jgi:zinc protease
MFKGSPHVPEGVIDRLAEEAGGFTNAFTSGDMTVYSDVAAAPMLERFLWIEGDRLAGLPEALDQAKLENQRDVVLNERRQNYENLPYGMAEILLAEATWPEGHPYRAPTIGYVADLESVTVENARAFFRSHYTPARAVMVIAGDFDAADARRLVARYLGGLPPGTAPAPPRQAVLPPLASRKLLTAEDDVQVPRIYLRWRAPALYAREQPALDLAAIVLAGGKASRLYQRLVVEERVAQDVYAGYDAQPRAGDLTVRVTAKPGVEAARLQAILDAELARLVEGGVTAAELQRAKNIREADFLRGLADLEHRALQLLEYTVLARNPDYLEPDLARYRAVTARDLQAAAACWLRPHAAVVLTISPRGHAHGR